MKKAAKLLLASSLLLSALPVSGLALAQEHTLTRAEAVNYLLGISDDYAPNVGKGDILRGDAKGNTNEDRAVTRIEALLMLGRAFPDLPAPKGNDLRQTGTPAAFTDVPAWAQSELSRLAQAGIVGATADGKLGASQPVTLEQLTTFTHRAMALEGSNPRDDYYEYINKDWLNKSTIDSGEATNGVFNELTASNDSRLGEMIAQIASGPQTAGSVEQKIADFYGNALDVKHRDEQGVEPIAKYLKAIDEASGVQQLLDVTTKMEDELSTGSIFSFGITSDAKNSSVNALYFGGMSTVLDKSSYEAGDAKVKQLYTSYLSALFRLAGSDAESAQSQAESMFAFEKQLAAASMDIQDTGDVNKYYNPYTIKEFEALYPSIDMAKVLKEFKLDSADKIIVTDIKLTKKSAELLKSGNLPALKAYTKALLLIDTSGVLSEDLEKLNEDFQAQMFGIEGQKTRQQKAVALTQSVMDDYLGRMFAERYFSPEAKQDVEKMVGQFIGVYKQRIQDLDWMSETTKAKALKKLDTMKIKVGYPDKWEDSLKNVSIASVKNGGSLFDNFIAIGKASKKEAIESLGQPADKDGWAMSVYTVNAYYNPMNNEIVFPAGILQAPFYDIDAKHETNMGAIGMVIAHEISHAFDNMGSAYDENGNALNWWTEEDYAKFKQKLQRVVEYYDSVEIMPGVTNNGALTVSENVADLGGMAASLQVLSQMQNPDYKAYFEGYATIWRTTMNRETAAYLSANDTHSANKVRVNRTIANYPEFYQAYGITEKDAMYVAPEERVSIW
ncbi:M13 family metallopeptidase [Saccharibacillus sp. CPCC 101409]|uniref:M13 family metallopeptidase n=1 Tax=Saccharibacillus sp. CPCC 101409 TaxID=3058041 RepID=UPI002673BF92|nr:M13 family metallopeptidase [Saccharibacillus sp. CPCC 101409]MDO3411109.1 M13 family metallopeptidase [Saccharibacillus sp. CPCC 101409]